MLALTATFVAQQVLIVPRSYHAYLFLSGYGMKSWHLWELLTCLGFHSNHSLPAGVAHLLVNLAGLWFLGRAVERSWGHARFCLLFFGTGVVGALAQGLVGMTGFLLPDSLANAADFLVARFGESVGSSIGLCGVAAVYCLERQATARWLLTLALVVAGVLIVVPSDATLAHVGHAVGLLAGMVAYRCARRGPARTPTSPGGTGIP